MATALIGSNLFSLTANAAVGDQWFGASQCIATGVVTGMPQVVRTLKQLLADEVAGSPHAHTQYCCAREAEESANAELHRRRETWGEEEAS